MPRAYTAAVDTCTLSARGLSRVQAGHPWIFAVDVAKAPASEADVVLVADPRGRVVGTALYGGPRAPLALRMLARGPTPVALDRALLAERLAAALARRAVSFGARDAYRVVHGEADALPGLFVDRYGDALVLQSATRAMDVREELIADVLLEVVPGARRVAVRDDSSVRDLEGLARRTGMLRGAAQGSRATYHEGLTEIEVDLLEDGKTGGYLDQVDNHVRAGELAQGEALDCFSYHGGFALALARRASHVIACDQNPAAVERARANAARNRLSNLECVADNAFDLLRRFDGEDGRGFDTIVIDPPAFAKRKGAIEAAERAYLELNLRALRLLRPGGLLVSCSCSAKMTPDRFGAMLERAARDARRQVQVLERRGAGADHPGLLGVPETEYLKCWLLRVL